MSELPNCPGCGHPVGDKYRGHGDDPTIVGDLCSGEYGGFFDRDLPCECTLTRAEIEMIFASRAAVEST